ncbi:MAG: glycosyltransferase family 39 protein [Chloroflexi bacterium]|nr:glycosyltransferase family 39 protein [Chloroflexota bacterium]
MWRLAILLLAVFLRLGGLATVPPGLTHDEAVHGLTAWEIVEGARPLYIAVANGREPLFDYATAAVMALIGPSGFAVRLTAVYFSLLLLALSYAWVRRAFNERVALLTLATFALNFWAVMTARHALRSITLPTLFTAAVLLWWWVASQPVSQSASQLVSHPKSKIQNQKSKIAIPLAGFLLGLAAYTYFPIRLLWVLFPAAVASWWLIAPAWAARAWRPTLLLLGVAALTAAPLAVYLWQTPTAEARISQLAQPIEAARAGDFAPLLANSTAALRSLVVPGAGDSAWRYNIAGQPLLPNFFAWLAGFGLLILLWQWRKPAHSLALLWLGLALLPVLVTGSALSVPRAIGLQPVLFILPALALDWALGWRGREEERGSRGAGEQGSRGDEAIPNPQSAIQNPQSPVPVVGWLAIGLLYGLMGLQTVQGYFVEWANHPEVRLQYEAAVVTALHSLNDQPPTSAAFSVATPGRYHAQAIALLSTQYSALSTQRFFNGQHSLLLPSGADNPTVIFVGAAQPAAEWEPLMADFAAVTILPQPATDIDQPIVVYTASAEQVRVGWQAAVAEPETAVVFGQTVRLVGHIATQEEGVLRLQTLWEVVGEGTGTAEQILFAQLLGADGVPIAQNDRLDVPSNQWQVGDLFWQMHVLLLPAGVHAADLPLIIGFYDAAEPLRRWEVVVGGRGAGDFYPLVGDK